MNAPDQESPSLELLRQRDADAFVWLVEQHQPLVLALGQSMGLSGADLEDAAAEVFDNVHRSLPTFEGRSPLKTWVYRIALRTLARFRQRLRLRAAAALPDEVHDPRQARPDEQLVAEESNTRVWDAVASLGPRQALMIDLHYRHGWPLEEIAEAMECPVGTVKTLLFRARERLRELLRDREMRR